MSFKILIAGLDNVGKTTIIRKFNEGYSELKEKFKTGVHLRDGEDKLAELDIQIESHTITQSEIVNEYIPKKLIDMNQYQMIVIVFDLGEKDSLKELASKLQGSALDFTQIKASCKCALWGNKQDKFKFDSDADQRTAQKAFELERDFMKLGYVKSNSLNTEQNEPFQKINILIQEYQRSCNSTVSSPQTSKTSSNYSDEQEESQIDSKFLQRSDQKKNQSRRVVNKNQNCSISSLKCQAQEIIPTRPPMKRKKKLDNDDEVFSAKSGSKCTIF